MSGRRNRRVGRELEHYGPTTSTMPPARVARLSWCHRPRRQGYLDGSRGRALAIARFGRCTRSDDESGKRHLATIGKPVWRTPSSGTSRSSGTAFTRAVRRDRGLRPSSHAIPVAGLRRTPSGGDRHGLGRWRAKSESCTNAPARANKRCRPRVPVFSHDVLPPCSVSSRRSLTR